VSLSGRKITKLVLTGGAGDVVLTNCTVGEVENQSGTAVTLYLVGTAAPALTATSGAIGLATVSNITDISSASLTAIADAVRTSLGTVQANIVQVNSVAVTGNGQEGTEWGPAP